MRPAFGAARAAALGLLLLPWTSTGAQQPGASRNDPRPVARAAPRTSAVAVDGRLDDGAWSAATPIGELRQQSPDEGQPPSERTEIRILYDDAALYVGARMYDTAEVRRLLVRRDQLIDSDAGSDKIALVLDPYLDRSTRVWFELNPLGVKGDHLNGDGSWDPVWEGAAHIDSLGWSAEFRIPFSQLRFSSDTAQVWGFQVWRSLSRRNEYDMWAFWRANEPGGPAYFGTVEGIVVRRQPRQLELLPYIVSRETFERAEDGDPFRTSNHVRAIRAGGDLKVNLTPTLMLDATVNPDFGQVEVDPAVVNLSAFETFFEERRPFFVANSGAFSFGSFNCFFCSNVSSLSVFYPRRIGRAPQLAGVIAGRSDFMAVADAANILGAAKVTGRTRGGVQVGLLDAVTDRAVARYIPTGGGDVLHAEVEPRANYFVGRLRRDLRDGRTRVGIITTLTNRFLSDTVQENRLRSAGQALGADVAHYWDDRKYSLLANAVVSSVSGSASAIALTQRSSARYFQRPGRTTAGDGLFDAAYDLTRTSLRGYGFYARVGKDDGNWLWETAQNWRSPGFEVNDLAFQSRADYKWMNANVVRRWTTPGRWYRSVWTNAGAQLQYDYDGNVTEADAHAYASATFHNYMNVEAFAIHHPRTLDPGLTRGGPIVKNGGYDFFRIEFGGDSRKPVAWELGLEHARSLATEGWSFGISPEVVLRPSRMLRLSLSPGYVRDVTAAQYVQQVADAHAPAGFDGTRYVFGTIDYRSFNLSTRVNATFTPTLTLEMFAQPFVASGRYYEFKEFVAPRSGDTRVFGRDVGTASPVEGGYVVDPDGAGPAAAFTLADPNFNQRSLRGTAVVRWEYRPGSTLFFVWTQDRFSAGDTGTLDYVRERRALLGARPTNVFQVKASYWLGL